MSTTAEDGRSNPVKVAIHREESFRILTQNVWCHYPMSFLKQCPRAMPGRNTLQRLDVHAEHCSREQYDIVAIQVERTDTCRPCLQRSYRVPAT